MQQARARRRTSALRQHGRRAVMRYNTRLSHHTCGACRPHARASRRSAARAIAEPHSAEWEAVNHQEKSKSSSVDLEQVDINEDVARELYKDMRLGRDFEDMCAQMYYRGKMFGFVHLYTGQEACSTGVIKLLKKEDYVCRCAASRRVICCVCLCVARAR